MRRGLAILAAVFFGLCWQGTARCQEIKFGELNIVRQGEGWIDVGESKTDDLSRIQFLCLTDGRLDIAVWGRKRWSLTGRWDGGRSEVVELTLTGGDATGRGRAYLVPVSWRPLTLDLKLIQVDGSAGLRPFSMTFRTSKADPWPQPDPWPGDFTQLDADERGGGSMRRDGPWPEPIDRARVQLRRNGSFEIHLYGNSQWLFTGDWRKGRGDLVELRVTGGLLGSSTSGSGTVNLKTKWGGYADDDFDALQIDARSGFQTMQAKFQPGATPPPTPQPYPIGPIQKMDEDRSGNGLMAVQGWSPDRLTDVHVLLRRDGSCEIGLEGRDRYTFKGNWQNRDTYADLRINASTDDWGARGGGKVYFNRKGSFSRVEMNGTYKQRSFTVQFDVVR